MKRRHLIELHEQSWFPSRLREDFVEVLSSVLWLVRAYAGVGEVFSDWLKRTRIAEVLDLASGGGGPILVLRSGLTRRGTATPRFLVSDLFPNRDRFARLERETEGAIQGIPESVDARSVPAWLRGPERGRTIISSFHHFQPAEALEILDDAARHSGGICILEPFQRTPRHLLLGPLSVFPALLAPLCERRPDPVKMLFTYLIPILPLLLIFDTVVSVLRCHTAEEIRGMIGRLPSDGFQWRFGSLRYMLFFRSTYVVGFPRGAA